MIAPVWSGRKTSKEGCFWSVSPPAHAAGNGPPSALAWSSTRPPAARTPPGPIRFASAVPHQGSSVLRSKLQPSNNETIFLLSRIAQSETYYSSTVASVQCWRCDCAQPCKSASPATLVADSNTGLADSQHQVKTNAISVCEPVHQQGWIGGIYDMMGLTCKSHRSRNRTTSPIWPSLSSTIWVWHWMYTQLPSKLYSNMLQNFLCCLQRVLGFGDGLIRLTWERIAKKVWSTLATIKLTIFSPSRCFSNEMFEKWRATERRNDGQIIAEREESLCN